MRESAAGPRDPPRTEPRPRSASSACGTLPRAARRARQAPLPRRPSQVQPPAHRPPPRRVRDPAAASLRIQVQGQLLQTREGHRSDRRPGRDAQPRGCDLRPADLGRRLHAQGRQGDDPRHQLPAAGRPEPARGRDPQRTRGRRSQRAAACFGRILDSRPSGGNGDHAMNQAKRFARDVFDDMVERKLWPVALILLVALIAIPVVLAKPASESTAPLPGAAATAPAVSGASSPLTAFEPVVSAAHDGASRRACAAGAQEPVLAQGHRLLRRRRRPAASSRSRASAAQGLDRRDRRGCGRHRRAPGGDARAGAAPARRHGARPILHLHGQGPLRRGGRHQDAARCPSSAPCRAPTTRSRSSWA